MLRRRTSYSKITILAEKRRWSQIGLIRWLPDHTEVTRPPAGFDVCLLFSERNLSITGLTRHVVQILWTSPTVFQSRRRSLAPPPRHHTCSNTTRPPDIPASLTDSRLLSLQQRRCLRPRTRLPRRSPRSIFLAPMPNCGRRAVVPDSRLPR